MNDSTIWKSGNLSIECIPTDQIYNGNKVFLVRSNFPIGPDDIVNALSIKQQVKMSTIHLHTFCLEYHDFLTTVLMPIKLFLPIPEEA